MSNPLRDILSYFRHSRCFKHTIAASVVTPIAVDAVQRYRIPEKCFDAAERYRIIEKLNEIFPTVTTREILRNQKVIGTIFVGIACSALIILVPAACRDVTIAGCTIWHIIFNFHKPTWVNSDLINQILAFLYKKRPRKPRNSGNEGTSQVLLAQHSSKGEYAEMEQDEGFEELRAAAAERIKRQAFEAQLRMMEREREHKAEMEKMREQWAVEEAERKAKAVKVRAVKQRELDEARKELDRVNRMVQEREDNGKV